MSLWVVMGHDAFIRDVTVHRGVADPFAFLGVE